MKFKLFTVAAESSLFSARGLIRALVILPLFVLVGCVSNPAPSSPAVQFAGVWEHVGDFKKLNTDPVFTPETAASVERQTRLRAAGDLSGDFSSTCIPPAAHTMTTIGAQEILVDEKKITWIMEVISGIRWIWLDGRDNPDLEEVRLTANGYSTGHWEGDVLVVETIGFMDKSIVYVNRPGNESIFPSPQMRMVERMRVIDDGKTMINERVLYDPVNLAEPWRTTVRYELRPDWEIEEAICAENNRTEEY